MRQHVCPWWVGYLLLFPLRRWRQDPAALLGPLVSPGDTVLEPGPAMGFFTLELARRVGPSGRVIAVDLQPRMLRRLERRAERAGLRERIETRLASADSLGIDDLAGRVDFVPAIFVVHEMPDARAFFAQAASALKPGGRLLLAEPKGHVKAAEFERQLEAAGEAGLRRERPYPFSGAHAELLISGR